MLFRSVEAMAAGLPIVTTDAPGVRDVIDEGVNGLKSQVKDVDAMAELIMKVSGDRLLAEKLSANSIRDARDHYDWKTVTGKYLALYGETIRKK